MPDHRTAASPALIPDAVAAVIAAVLTRHPAASSDVLGRLVVTELRAEGWHIAAPHVYVAA